MKMRMLLLVIPCFMAVGCGTQAETKDELRGEQVEPCTPDDCIPLGALIEDDCPPGTELISSSECIEADGECVWDFSDECVPVDEADPVPPPMPEQPPRPIRPR